MKAHLNIISVCFSALLLAGSCFCDIEKIDASEFDTFVRANQHVLILFMASDECPDCNQALKYFDRLPQPDLVQTEVLKRYVIDDGIAGRLGALDYSSVVYFRHGVPALYKGKLNSVDEIPELIEWMTQASQVATQDLYDDSFEHLTQASTGATTGDWFVLFYEPGCDECMKILPSVESAAIRNMQWQNVNQINNYNSTNLFLGDITDSSQASSVKHRMNFAKVNVALNKKLAERFNITACPYGILFKQGKMFPYEPAKFDAQSLVAFTETWYKNVKSSPVPKEPTAFDILTESIALYIKQQVENPNRSWIFTLGVVSVCLFLVVLIVCVFRKPKDSRRKHD